MDAAPPDVGDRDPSVGPDRDRHRQDEGVEVGALLADDERAQRSAGAAAGSEAGERAQVGELRRIGREGPLQRHLRQLDARREAGAAACDQGGDSEPTATTAAPRPRPLAPLALPAPRLRWRHGERG